MSVAFALAGSAIFMASPVMTPPASAASNECDYTNGFVWHTEQDMADAYGEYCRSTWLLDPGVGKLISRSFLVGSGSSLFHAKGFSENFLWYAPYQVMTLRAGSAQRWVSCTPATHGSGYGGNPACSPAHVVSGSHTISYDFGNSAVGLHVYSYGGNFITAVCGNYGIPLALAHGSVPYPVPVISGSVFNDSNKNGTQNTGEPGIGGWTVVLTRNSSLYHDQPAGQVATTKTDGNGDYTFPLNGIGPGTYTVSEGSQQYWHPTNGTARTVVVGAGIGSATINAAPFGDWFNQAPVAVIGSVPPEDQTSAAGASVTLDGSASHDPDGDSLTYTWSGPFGTATGVNPTVTMPAGTSQVSLTVSDGERSDSATTPVTIYPPITAAGGTLSGPEGHVITGTDATFTDPDPNASSDEYTATINWGDGTPPTQDAPITKDPSGTFTVTAPHTYDDEGHYQATITITDTDNAFNTATVTTPVTVSDAPLQATGTSITTNPLSGYPVATFTDDNPDATTTDFTATINWGDNTTTTGTVTGQTGGPFTVTGTHRYATSGSYTITIHISDDGGSTATATSQARLSCQHHHHHHHRRRRH